MGFRNPIIGGTNAGDTSGSRELIIPGITSDNYVEGSQGWRIGEDGSAQFDNAQILNALGATALTADSITINGEDLVQDILNVPGGLTAQGSVSAAVQTASVSAETIMFQFNAGTMYGNRYYRLSYRGLLQGTVAGDIFDIRIRYTVDGSIPTLTSGYFFGGIYRVGIQGANLSASFHNSVVYTPASDHDTMRFAVTLVRVAGTGTAFVWVINGEHGFQISAEDIGLQANVGGTISVVSKTSGVPDPDPTATYTKTFSALWSRSYDANGGIRAGDDTTHCYQGYYSGTHGNTRSLVGFDYAAIMAALSGATVNSVKLTFKVLHTYNNSGSTIEIGGHNYTTKPSTWNGANVAEQQVTKPSAIAGSSYTITLPAIFGTNLKSGTWKGIAFGEAPSNSLAYYAYLAGYGDSGAPKLTITYTK